MRANALSGGAPCYIDGGKCWGQEAPSCPGLALRSVSAHLAVSILGCLPLLDCGPRLGPWELRQQLSTRSF